jgi:lipoprotein-releasing system ATP-binding protein
MGVLQAEAIRKSYPTSGGELTVLRDVSLTLETGASAAIVGPSGSGKSTFLNILGTLEPPTAGQVRLDGCDPYSLSPRELARFRNRQVGLVFQDHHLLPQCSVLENVLLPTLAERGSTDAEARAHELLIRVGLTDRLNHRPAELSGGERQRVAIARALINRPKLLLADEPTGNLDRQTATHVGQLLLELHGEQALILLVVTHSPALADQCRQRYELADGKLVPR